MTTFLQKNPLPWATNPNYAAGSNPWSGTPLRVQPSSGVAAAGFEPSKLAPAQYMNYLLGTAGDSLSVGALNQIHSALQSWKLSLIYGGPSPVSFNELVGVQPARGYDVHSERQRMPLVLGINSGDSNRTYQNRSCDGSTWGNYGEINIASGAVHMPNLSHAAAGSPGVVLAGQATGAGYAYTTDHGTNWTLTSVSSGGSGNILAFHYADGISKYFVAHNSGVFVASTAAGLNVPSVVTVPTPSASSITAAEFADDGGSNVVMAASCGAVSNAALYLSTNSGTSWTKVQDLTATTGTANVKYSKAYGLFIAWDKTGVWTSPTGSIWTQVAGSVAATADMVTGQASFAVAGYAIVKLWRSVAVSSLLWNWGIAYSLDLGTTWNTWGIGNPEQLSGPTQLRSFNNRLYLLDAHSGSLWASGQVGFADTES